MKSKNENIVGNLVRVKLVLGGNSSGSVVAKELSRETAINHGADERSVKTSLMWMPAEYRKGLSGATSALRAIFNGRTLPWEDGGYRVIPADRYNALMDAVAKGKEEIEAQVNRVASNWDDILADARRRLNGAMKMIEVPTKEQYVDSFRIDLTSSCVVAPEDVRITGLDDATLDRIRNQVRVEIGERITEGIRSLGQTLVDLLDDLTERIDKPEQKGIRYDGWVKWAKSTIETIRPLNLTNDPSVNALIDRVEKIAANMDPHSMRNSIAERQRIKQLAKDKTVLEPFCN